jgi:plasmid maintenance system antidote protein VapI
MTRYKTKQNANALKEWMWIMAFSATDLSKLLDICESTVHQLRRGAVAPSLETALCLHRMSNGYVNLWRWQDAQYIQKMYQRTKFTKLTEAEKKFKRRRLNLKKPLTLNRTKESLLERRS